MGPREGAPQAEAPWLPRAQEPPDQRTGWGGSPQCTLQRRAVSLSLLNANLSAQESVCRALFLLQLPREIIQIPGGENIFGNELLPLSVPLVGGGEGKGGWLSDLGAPGFLGDSCKTVRGRGTPGVPDLFLLLPSTLQPLWMVSPARTWGGPFTSCPSLTQNLAPSKLPLFLGCSSRGDRERGQRGCPPRPACRARGRGDEARPDTGTEFGPPQP